MASFFGATSALAFAPLHLAFMFPTAFGGMFLLLERTRSVRAALLLGWLYGLGSFLVGLHWITEAFAVDADCFGALAWPALIALASGLAIFPALSIAAARALAGARGGLHLAAALAACWVAGEWLRGTPLTGFPWNIAGYAWGFSDTLLQPAALLGIHGLGLFAVVVAIMPALAWQQRRVWPIPAAIARGFTPRFSRVSGLPSSSQAWCDSSCATIRWIGQRSMPRRWSTAAGRNGSSRCLRHCIKTGKLGRTARKRASGCGAPARWPVSLRPA